MCKRPAHGVLAIVKQHHNIFCTLPSYDIKTAQYIREWELEAADQKVNGCMGPNHARQKSAPIFPIRKSIKFFEIFDMLQTVVETVQYIQKSGAIMKQHYNTFFLRCANGLIRPKVVCYYEATLQHFCLTMCKRPNTSAHGVLL